MFSGNSATSLAKLEGFSSSCAAAVITKSETMGLIEGYFICADKIKMCENNIAYTNQTCKKEANEIRRMKQLGDDYIVGDRVTSKKY